MGTDFEMFPNLTNLSLLLATILLLLTPAKGEGKDFCCKEKMVGSTNYTLLPNNHHHLLPLACLDNCVYTVANTSTPKYCFEKGDLPTKCLSDTTTTTTTTPTTTTTTTVPKGVVSSPNFPNRPPSNLDKEYTIEVEQGLVLRLEFTEFYLDYGWGYIEKEGKYGYVCDGCSHLTIIDGDGTTFLEKFCGGRLPVTILSKSNKVTLLFHTPEKVNVNDEWRFEWIAEKPSLSKM